MLEHNAVPQYFARDGKPITLQDWYTLFEKEEYSRIAITTLWNGIVVSTVWLGLDYSFGGGPPLIFETMVFAPDDVDVARYTTEAKALAGHERMVQRWRWRYWIWAAYLIEFIHNKTTELWRKHVLPKLLSVVDRIHGYTGTSSSKNTK